MDENIKLKEQVENFKFILEKISIRSCNLKLLLYNQRTKFHRCDLGFGGQKWNFRNPRVKLEKCQKI